VKVVCLVLAILVLLGAGHLFRVELLRFRADPAPAPPLPPEKAALESWHARMALLIASLSILAALNVWLASSAFGGASDLGQQVLQDETQYQTVLAVQNSRIEFGARLSLLYQQHLFTEDQLYNEATADRDVGNTNEALQLEAEARLEGAQERALNTGFLYYSPETTLSGASKFNVPEEKAVAKEEHRDLIALDPSHLSTIQSEVNGDRNEGQQIVLATALFVAAIFFFTVTNLGWRHHRWRTMTPGLVATAAGLALLTAAVV
jgi:hypothetical protein